MHDEMHDVCCVDLIIAGEEIISSVRRYVIKPSQFQCCEETDITPL